MVGGAVADNPDNFIVGEDNGYGVAVISGDFGIGEEGLELFGAGHAEGEKRSPFRRRRTVIGPDTLSMSKSEEYGSAFHSLEVASSTVAVIFQPGSKVSPGTAIGCFFFGEGGWGCGGRLGQSDVVVA